MPQQIDEIFVSIGPGSFTGLRIGITLAKTLAFATGAKIVAVPTVLVLAENAPPETTNLVIVLDAKREQIFTARFARESDQWIEREPAHLDDLPLALSRAPRPVWLLGEGIPHHQKVLPADDPSIILTPPQLWRPSAAVVANLGIKLTKQNAFADADSLTPLYIRKPEAQEVWERKYAHEPKTAPTG
jgi:tRNA threonylcarbamoyladenosine biosynthesis protein TsaB